MGILLEAPLLGLSHIFVPPKILQGHQINLPIPLVVILVLSVALLLRQSKTRQRIVPGIPIVGGNDKAAVLRNRKRFIHDGKSMLLEGYQKVETFDLY